MTPRDAVTEQAAPEAIEQGCHMLRLCRPCSGPRAGVAAAAEARRLFLI